MRQLSKSKLIAYRQCPKRLWLELNKPELRDDSGSEAAFQVGYQVGDVAQSIFDPEKTGINVDPNQIGWDESAAQTKESLESGDGPVFEALLRIPGALALADVMRPIRDFGDLQWEMIEVKSSTGVKDTHRDDVAIQTYIAQSAGIKLSKVGVAHINNQFVYPGNGDYQGLLHVEDLTEEAKGRHAEVEQWIEDAQSTAALEDEPVVEVGNHCSTPFTCGFCHYCWKDVPQPQIPTNILPRIRKTKLKNWESRGITELCDAPDHEINAIQQRVKAATLAGETYFDGAGAAAALGGQATPAYFLDFETIMFAVPIWKGTRPYRQLTFQFSLHRVDADGTVHHSEFLDISGDDPREAFVQAMIKDCGNSGPIYVYNSPFENTRIKELAEAFPGYADKLRALLPRVVDLLPIARDHYYHPDQRGSWSLKAVLPAICPELKYSDMEGVQVGSDAGLAYLEAISPETTPERKQELRQQMLAYCKLDTLATVRILEFFKGV